MLAKVLSPNFSAKSIVNFLPCVSAFMKYAELWGMIPDPRKLRWLMLDFRVLFDQQLNQSVKEGFSSFADIMDELEKTKIERQLFL